MTEEELRSACRDRIGQENTGDWTEISQEMINLFADATGDHQWIHTDPERAKKESPFGGPIAHGFLTLSLGPLLMGVLDPAREVLPQARMVVNYGLNKVRFPAPVPAGGKMRGISSVVEVDDIPGGAQVVSKITMEVEGGSKPACVAEFVFRLFA